MLEEKQAFDFTYKGNLVKAFIKEIRGVKSTDSSNGIQLTIFVVFNHPITNELIEIPQPIEHDIEKEWTVENLSN